MNIPWQFEATGQEYTYRLAVRLYIDNLMARVKADGEITALAVVAFIQKDLADVSSDNREGLDK